MLITALKLVVAGACVSGLAGVGIGKSLILSFFIIVVFYIIKRNGGNTTKLEGVFTLIATIAFYLSLEGNFPYFWSYLSIPNVLSSILISSAKASVLASSILAFNRIVFGPELLKWSTFYNNTLQFANKLFNPFSNRLNRFKFFKYIKYSVKFVAILVYFKVLLPLIIFSICNLIIFINIQGYDTPHNGEITCGGCTHFSTMRDGTCVPYSSIYPEDSPFYREMYYSSVQKEILDSGRVVVFLKEFVLRKCLSGPLFPIDSPSEKNILIFNPLVNFYYMVGKNIYVPKEFFIIKDKSELLILLKFTGEYSYEEFVQIVKLRTNLVLSNKLSDSGYYCNSTDFFTVIVECGASLYDKIKILYIYIKFYFYYESYRQSSFNDLCFDQGAKAIGLCFEYSDRYCEDVMSEGSFWIGKNYIFDNPYVIKVEHISFNNRVLLFLFKNSSYYSKNGLETLKIFLTEVTYFDIKSNKYLDSNKIDTSEYKDLDLRNHPFIGDYYIPVVKYHDYVMEYSKNNPKVLESFTKDEIARIVSLNRKVFFIERSIEQSNLDSFLLKYSTSYFSKSDMVYEENNLPSLEPY